MQITSGTSSDDITTCGYICGSRNSCFFPDFPLRPPLLLPPFSFFGFGLNALALSGNATYFASCVKLVGTSFILPIALSVLFFPIAIISALGSTICTFSTSLAMATLAASCLSSPSSWMHISYTTFSKACLCILTPPPSNGVPFPYLVLFKILPLPLLDPGLASISPFLSFSLSFFLELFLSFFFFFVGGDLMSPPAAASSISTSLPCSS